MIPSYIWFRGPSVPHSTNTMYATLNSASLCMRDVSQVTPLFGSHMGPLLDVVGYILGPTWYPCYFGQGPQVGIPNRVPEMHNMKMDMKVTLTKSVKGTGAEKQKSPEQSAQG